MKELLSQTQMQKVRDFEKGFVATHLIHMGSKLGLFETLSKTRQGLTSDELAVRQGLHEPYVRIWCCTAYHFGILEVDASGRFTLEPFLTEILADTSHFKNYQGNIATSVEVFGRLFDRFPEYFKTGEPYENLYTPEMSRAYYEATKNIHLVFRYMILPRNHLLKEALERGCKFLDIGCGRASLIVALAQVFEASSFVGIDPNLYGIEEAKKAISQLGLGKRVSVENIGGEELAYVNEFDVATMVANVHEIKPGLRETVLRNAFQALKAEGQLLLLDFPFPAEMVDFRNPLYDFAILDQFRKAIVGYGHTSTYKRDHMLGSVGFKDLDRRTIGRGMFELVTATK